MAFQNFNQTFIAYCLCALNVYNFVFAVRFFFLSMKYLHLHLMHFVVSVIFVELVLTNQIRKLDFRTVSNIFLQSFKTSEHHSMPAIQCLFYPFSWAMSFHILLFIYDKNDQNRIFALVSNFNDEYARNFIRTKNKTKTIYLFM